ncbi:hypothetical protein KIPB_011314, partial [Kipferlia bialata]
FCRTALTSEAGSVEVLCAAVELHRHTVDPESTLQSVSSQLSRVIIGHTVERPPLMDRTLTLQEAKNTIAYLASTLLAHYKLHRYLFVPQPTLSLSCVDAMPIESPPAVPSLASAQYVPPEPEEVEEVPVPPPEEDVLAEVDATVTAVQDAKDAAAEGEEPGKDTAAIVSAIRAATEVQICQLRNELAARIAEMENGTEDE